MSWPCTRCTPSAELAPEVHKQQTTAERANCINSINRNTPSGASLLHKQHKRQLPVAKPSQSQAKPSLFERCAGPRCSRLGITRRRARRPTAHRDRRREAVPTCYDRPLAAAREDNKPRWSLVVPVSLPELLPLFRIDAAGACRRPPWTPGATLRRRRRLPRAQRPMGYCEVLPAQIFVLAG